MSVFIKQCYFSKINTKINKPEIISFLKSENSIYSILAVAKSAAEPENSNNRHTANSSTPLIRAFFVCDIHSSNERLETLRGSERPYELGMSVFGHTPILSMVACSGKGSPFAAYRVRAVSQPVTRYRPNPEKFSGSPKNLHTELSAMIYLFKAVNRLDLRKTQKPFTSFPHYTLKVKADSVEQAQAKISRLFAVLSVSLVNNSANMTACDTEQNNSLPNAGSCGHNDLTTTYDANRKRDTSGLFLPKIHQYHGLTTPKIYSELAVRATPRNKALSTNKGGYSYVAVEPLSHLSQSDKSFYSLTKTYDTMNKPTLFYKALIGTTSAIVSSPRFEGVQYA
ncbi:ash family protein [Mannheimia haemolytica]